MFKRRKMRLNGEWSLIAGNRVYELRLTHAERQTHYHFCTKCLKIHIGMNENKLL
jgi:hypothetical protein